MPFTLEWSGADELLRKMDKLPEKAAKIAAEALYEGADVMADAVSRAVQGIATEEFHYAKGGETRMPSPEEKAIVMNQRRGISKFKNNGTVISTKVGVSSDGYSKITWNHAKSGTRTKYKIGLGGKATGSQSQEGKSSGLSAKPVAVIINSIEHGTSFMKKQPFMRKAIQQTKGAAMAAIDAGIKKRENELDLD